MINKWIGIGRITKDIELRKTNSGKSCVQFTLAVNRNVKSDGQPEADFIQCVAWNKNADNLAAYTGKGSLIGVEGHIATRSYDSQNGKVYVTEVIVDTMQFLSQKQGYTQNSQTYQQPQYTNELMNQNHEEEYKNPFGSSGSFELNSDDLPFY